MKATLFFTQHIFTTSSTEPYNFMKIILTILKKTEHCSLNNQGEITRKVCKQELLFLYVTHHHDLFYITVKYHATIPKGI